MKQIVYTPGVWDLLHVGHLNIIKTAKRLCDFLIVGVCCDKLVKLHKGQFPTINEHNRSEMIRAIKYVDDVFVYTDADQTTQLKLFQPDIFVVGEEFGSQGVPEHETALMFASENGIEIKRVNRLKGISTTSIKSNIR